jgi:hypothetical protein
LNESGCTRASTLVKASENRAIRVRRLQLN